MARPWLCLVVAAALLAGCGGGGQTTAGTVQASDRGPQHAHGLGVNPSDGAVYIATHSGLWRAPLGVGKATRVGERRDDLMGFTIVRADTFLASGHPDPGRGLPDPLGLQRSTDAGNRWKTVALLGQADLHVLRASGRRIYGIDAGLDRFLTSDDGGRTWQLRASPAPIIDLAISPGDPDHVVAATISGLFASSDTGSTWPQLRDDLTGMLAWPTVDRLYLLQSDGTVLRSANRGRSFARIGSIRARPQAFSAASAHELYAAIHGAQVLVSSDGGANWRLRAKP